MDELVTVEQVDNPFWWLVHPTDLEADDAQHVRGAKKTQTLCLVLECNPDTASVSDYSKACELLNEEDTFPDLERVQLSGSMVLRCNENPGEMIVRTAPRPVMIFLAGRILSKVTLVDVDVQADVFVDFCNESEVKDLRLSGFRIVSDSEEPFQLCPHMERLEFDRVETKVILFVTKGITAEHRLHVKLGSAMEGCGMSLKMWKALREGTGKELAGVRAITFDSPTFKKETQVWPQLMHCPTVEMVNLVEATFTVEAFRTFLLYVGDIRSPLRQIGITHWNLVDGFSGGDEFDEFLWALGRGGVVWYSHRRTSCTHAERIANALPAMGLEALEIEIVKTPTSDDLIPTLQLLQAARVCTTLGVFNDPLRAARARAKGVSGLSAMGVNRYDYEWQDFFTYFDVFTPEEDAELQRVFQRNNSWNDDKMEWNKCHTEEEEEDRASVVRRNQFETAIESANLQYMVSQKRKREPTK